MKSIQLVTIAALGLAACAYIPGTEANKIAQAEARVAARMKDPDAVKFSNVRLADHGYVCGYLNAKNSFGAYNGNKGFVFDTSDNDFLMEDAVSSGNPGIDATNRCKYRALHPACMNGGDMMAANLKLMSDGRCSKEGMEAIDAHYKEQLKLLR